LISYRFPIPPTPTRINAGLGNVNIGGMTNGTVQQPPALRDQPEIAPTSPSASLPVPTLRNIRLQIVRASRKRAATSRVLLLQRNAEIG
jgi:hypothetical protein